MNSTDGLNAGKLNQETGASASNHTAIPANRGEAEVQDIVWISWLHHQRNKSMAAALNVALYEYKPKASRIVRYLKSAIWTISLLMRKSPRVVICTNPSIVLSLMLLVIRPLFKMAVVVDAHFVGVQAARGWERLQPVLDWLNRQADLVIVTNSAHADQIRNIGGKAFISPDPLPVLPPPGLLPGVDFEKSIFLICSFDVDEPYAEVFAAIEQDLQRDGFKLFVSGNYTRAAIDKTRYTAVHLLGYVPTADYIAYLRQASVIIDLTTVENCLVCGAYEALAAHQPLVLSNTRASVEYFKDAAIYTENNAAAIAQAIRTAYRERRQLAAKSKSWVEANKGYMSARIADLSTELRRLATHSGKESA